MAAGKYALAFVLAGCGSSNHGRTDAPGGDAELPVDAAVMPVAVAPDAWTFTSVPGTTCGDGSPAGVATNGAPASSTDLLVYFEGGGACWDSLTCFTIQSAINIQQPYTSASFQTDLPFLDMLPLVNRTGSAAVNPPFTNANYVYIPYCTGDLFAGDNVASYQVGSATKTVHHTGANNVATFATVLRATFPQVTRVWLVGSSAGGYGATFALPAFAAAWQGAELHVLQDSALFLTPMTAYAAMQASWKPAFPAGCTACSTDLSAVIGTLTQTYPASRIGLLTWSEDATLKTFLGYSGSLAPAIDALLGSAYAKPETAGFELAGSNHTMLFDEQALVGSGGVPLTAWVDEWATGSAAWTTVK